MEKMLGAFGVDYKLLIANFVNFGILLFVLYKIGYKPMLKFINDRTKTIEDGLKNAALAKQNIAEATQQQQAMLTTARQEAQSIVVAANDQAIKQSQLLIEKSKLEAKKVIDQAKLNIRQEHDQMMQQAKAELTDLVLLATEKVLQQKLDQSADEALLKKVVAQYENHS
ncbi:MAG: F0F1 ATP synthase subunit B [Candidatus Kerfeldbacteria bacterium]|nr:F0F1 ATP synthase subunit B [Candidatus Kerfeldbacteria bacterium]